MASKSSARERALRAAACAVLVFALFIGVHAAPDESASARRSESSAFALINSAASRIAATCSLQFCQVCSADGQTCITCFDRFFVDANGKCAYCTVISGCRLCSSASTCTTCETRYYPDNGQCTMCNIPSCLACSSATACTSCSQGFYLDASTPGAVGCTRCPSSCNQCQSPNVCTACNFPLVLVNGQCMPPPLAAPYATLAVFTNSSCLAPVDGAPVAVFSRTAAAGGCVADATGGSYMIMCGGSYQSSAVKVLFQGAACQGGASGLTYLATGYCQAPTAYAPRHWHTLTCADPPRVFTARLALFDSSACSPPSSAATDAVVTAGADAYIGTTAANCARFNATGSISCTSNVVSLYTGAGVDSCTGAPSATVSLSSTTSCSAMSPSQFWPGIYASGACGVGPCVLSPSPPPNCAGCASDAPGVCAACKDGYFLQNGASVSCAACSSRVAQCSSCSTDGSVCKLCAVGFYLSTSTSCSACTSLPMPGSAQCIECAAGMCTVCQTGFYLDVVNRCTACSNFSPGCSTCAGTWNSLKCTSCAPNFFVNQYGRCEACQDGCAVCANATSCATCQAGFHPNGSGACESCSAHCAACTGGGSSTCSACFDGYLLASQCTACDTGFYRNATDATCRRCPLSCAACVSPTQCSACNPMYALSSAGDACHPIVQSPFASTWVYTDSACSARLERIPTLVYSLSVDDGGCITTKAGGGGSSIVCVDGAPTRLLYGDSQCRGSVIGSDLIPSQCKSSTVGSGAYYQRMVCAPAPTRFVARFVTWQSSTCSVVSGVSNLGGVEYIGIGETSTCAANFSTSRDGSQFASISCSGTTLSEHMGPTCAGAALFSVPLSESVCTELPGGVASLRGVCFDGLPSGGGGSNVAVIVGSTVAACLVASAVLGYFFWHRRKVQLASSMNVDASYTSLQE